MPFKKKEGITVSVVHEIRCGLDVHKKSVSACITTTDAHGVKQCEMHEFETFTDNLLKLKEWLLERECPVVAMGSLGPSWTPIHNVLGG